jgi:hypothetical protein
VDKQHPKISMRKQSKLLGVARSTMTYKPVDEDPEDIRIKRLLDEIYMKDPCLGSRRLVTVLERDHGIMTDRKRVVRLRREIGQEALEMALNSTGKVPEIFNTDQGCQFTSAEWTGKTAVVLFSWKRAMLSKSLFYLVSTHSRRRPTSSKNCPLADCVPGILFRGSFWG